MNCLVSDIDNNPLFEDVKKDIEKVKFTLQELQQNYLEGTENLKCNAEKLLKGVDDFETLINSKLNLITDKVFVKQIKKRVSDNFSIAESNISHEEAAKIFEKFSSDIEDIINSRIPQWVSSMFYTFNSNWRKEVYTSIMNNYLILYTYVCEQRFVANNIDNEIQQLNIKFHNEAKAIVDSLLQLIVGKVNNELTFESV